ncbi:MAG TPA: hypothetical protein VN449_02515 [Gaiellaceae bacterium]|nr:hypothetical protein [Gaiellaceae bacterium]
MSVTQLHRTLDQELIAILRRASLECLVCGEFLLHRSDGIGCPQCGLEMPCGLELPYGLEFAGEAVAADRLTDESRA